MRFEDGVEGGGRQPKLWLERVEATAQDDLGGGGRSYDYRRGSKMRWFKAATIEDDVQEAGCIIKRVVSVCVCLVFDFY